MAHINELLFRKFLEIAHDAREIKNSPRSFSLSHKIIEFRLRLTCWRRNLKLCNVKRKQKKPRKHIRNNHEITNQKILNKKTTKITTKNKQKRKDIPWRSFFFFLQKIPWRSTNYQDVYLC